MCGTRRTRSSSPTHGIAGRRPGAQNSDVVLAHSRSRLPDLHRVHRTQQFPSDRRRIKKNGRARRTSSESPNNPNVRVLGDANSAEYWDGPGKIIGYAKMAVAAVTGTGPTTATTRRSRCGKRAPLRGSGAPHFGRCVTMAWPRRCADFVVGNASKARAARLLIPRTMMTNNKTLLLISTLIPAPSP